ncbi:MAG TPA: protocatechuate 3,4-dioxygenase subunit beta [Alphaproteobacteria bacterium]|nr:protocatechuate 3,4-dioxygenase subunit beta [Alphaproteobacteria bacterium]
MTPRPYSAPAPGVQPPYLHPDYKSTIGRAPKRALYKLPQTLSEVTGPRFDTAWHDGERTDMTRWENGEAQGQRIILAGRVLDEDGRPVPRTLLEIWQCNAAGRYRHERDQHDAPLDPHFRGVGQVVTNEQGEWRVLTIRPGAYPWRNTHNAWRAAHIHFSIFGPAFATRLVTQMYFPGDPLIPADPIINSVPDQKAREGMVCSYDPDLSEAEYAMGYRWDIVLRGRDATPTERA